MNVLDLEGILFEIKQAAKERCRSFFWQKSTNSR